MVLLNSTLIPGDMFTTEKLRRQAMRNTVSQFCFVSKFPGERTKNREQAVHVQVPENTLNYNLMMEPGL